MFFKWLFCSLFCSLFYGNGQPWHQVLTLKQPFEAKMSWVYWWKAYSCPITSLDLLCSDCRPQIWPLIYDTPRCQLSLLLLIDKKNSQSIRRSFLPFCAFRKERRRPLVDDICVYILHIYFSRDTLKSKKGFLQPRDWLFFVLSQNLLCCLLLFSMKLTMVVNLETISRERRGAKMINHIFRHNYRVLFEKSTVAQLFWASCYKTFNVWIEKKMYKLQSSDIHNNTTVTL